MSQDHPHADGQIEFGPTPPSKASIALLLLHGRGGRAKDMIELADRFVPRDVALVAPAARDDVWYPHSFLAQRRENQPWLDSALRRVGETIDLLGRLSIPPERIILFGFSQGACLAAEFCALKPQRYGGLIVATGGLIGPSVEPDRYQGDLARTPIVAAASHPDHHVPWERVEETVATFQRMNGQVEKARLDGEPHSVLPHHVRACSAMIEQLSFTVERDG
ncbi:MAG: hypothetical protein JJU36_06530 [Phycisphaeraceae bacterium]|nr:hypothetical protein [Phycisphaeraceae bacterium]